MNVAHVLPWISRHAGGLFHSVSGLARAQATLAGVRVGVFGARDEFSEVDRAHWHPVAVHTAPVVGPTRLCYTPALRGMLEAFAPDLIHSAAVWTWPAAVVNQVRGRRGTPYVLSPRGTLDAWALRRSRWKKALARRLFQQRHFEGAACLHALNEAEAQAIRAYGLKNPICIIPNGVELPDLGKAETRKPETLKYRNTETPAHDLSAFSVQLSALAFGGRKVLLFLGRIHPKKGLVNLLRAWAAVQVSGLRSHPAAGEWVLAIAGWDEAGHEAELKRLATELGIAWADVRGPHPQPLSRPTGEGGARAPGEGDPPRSTRSLQPSAFSVLFVGPLFGAAKAAAYRACDAFILPSFSEGMPMAVLEAWSYGKPVLMTPECNLPEGFVAGAAIRIEQETERTGGRRSIEEGLRELFQTPGATLQALGDNGRRLVAEQFAWPKIARDMQAVYAWVLGGGAPPASVLKG